MIIIMHTYYTVRVMHFQVLFILCMLLLDIMVNKEYLQFSDAEVSAFDFRNF